MYLWIWRNLVDSHVEFTFEIKHIPYLFYPNPSEKESNIQTIIVKIRLKMKYISFKLTHLKKKQVFPRSLYLPSAQMYYSWVMKVFGCIYIIGLLILTCWLVFHRNNYLGFDVLRQQLFKREYVPAYPLFFGLQEGLSVNIFNFSSVIRRFFISTIVLLTIGDGFLQTPPSTIII